MRLSFQACVLPAVIGLLLVVPSSATAGLKAHGTAYRTMKFVATLTDCMPVTLTRSVFLRLPHGSVSAKYSGPSRGHRFSSDHFELPDPTTRSAEIISVSARRRVRGFRIVMRLNVNPPGGCDAAIKLEGSVRLPIELKATYRLRSHDRFRGRMVTFDGRTQRRSVFGDYHGLRFVDRLGLRTRYRACAYGLFGIQCWRRTTDDEGLGDINASLAINDRVGPGRIVWYVDGRSVATWSYAMDPEGV